jgi:flotillin
MHMDNLIFVAAAIAVIIILVLITGYVKAPTDTAVIISGLKKEPKYVIGRSSIKIPFLQRTDKLTLKMISVDVKTEESVPTNDYINVNIDSAVKVKVSMDPEKMKLAASNFLNKNEDYIRTSVVDVLQGNVREIIGQMKLEEIVQDRKKFADKVQENAAPDMAKMGLDIVSFNVQNVTDNGNVIENLGIDRVVSISKSAQISRAESERDIAVAKANAEKEANDAKVASETAIAEQNNALEIKKQELKKQSDIKKAEADAAYEIQEQEQRKTIEIATADANIAKQEKEAEIKEKEIAVREKSLDAEIKKQADAEKYARIQKADADKYEAEQKAEAEKITKMKEAEAAKAQGIAEAEATKAKGMAEAETIRAKGMAEAEAMEKKADAMAKYGKAAMTEMIIKILPQMAEAIAKPLESIDKVSIIGGAGDSGMTTISDNVPQVLAKTIESVKETTGFDLTEVMKANTYDAKVNNNINVATDFGGKLAENAVRETVTELDSVPADNKLPKEQSHMTPQQKKIPKNKQ